MSTGRKRTSFQITSVTSDPNQSPSGQSIPSMVLNRLQSEVSPCSLHESSSQPTTPCLERKYISHGASGQGTGSSSRFRVVHLAVGGGGRCEPYRCGRWTCTDFVERPKGAGIRRVMENMRHAHSLESLEVIGQDRERGWVHSQDTAHLLAKPTRSRKEVYSGPPSPTHPEPDTSHIMDQQQTNKVQSLDSTVPTPLSRSHKPPHALRLDIDGEGRSVFRLSQSQPSSPQSGRRQPMMTSLQTPAAFTLDQNIFNLPEDDSVSSNSLIAIDNRIEQAMDLVKSHLLLAVREEVEQLREQIRELQQKNQQLELENRVLRALTHSADNTTHIT